MTYRKSGDITAVLSLTIGLGSGTLSVIVGTSRTVGESLEGLRRCLHEPCWV